MNQELLKRVEKLEDEVQDLNNKIEHLSTGIIILIRKIDPAGYEEAIIDDIDNVS